MIAPALKDDALLADIAAAPAREDLLHLWWLGQSGFLVKTGGITVLFDPYLSDSLTRKYAATDKPHVRMTERCVAPERLADIQVITSSHMHTDHFDIETLRPLFATNPDAAFLITMANLDEAGRRFGGCLPACTTGMSDGDAFSADGISIRAVIAAHNEVERDAAGRARYIGFIARLGRFCLYHSGDTLWHDDIVRDLRAARCDVAFVPINGNKPERRVAGNLNGTEAAALAKAGGARVAVPHHYQMFEFNTEPPDEFIAACARLAQDCRVPQCGERVTLRAT